VSNTLNIGAGSLREAVQCTVAGDTIWFAAAIAGDTIDLSDEMLYLQDDVHILNTHSQPVVLRSQGGAVLMILADAEVEVKNIHFQSSNVDDVCVINYGHLVLDDVTCFTTSTDKGIIQNLEEGVLEFKGSNLLK